MDRRPIDTRKKPRGRFSNNGPCYPAYNIPASDSSLTLNGTQEYRGCRNNFKKDKRSSSGSPVNWRCGQSKTDTGNQDSSTVNTELSAHDTECEEGAMAAILPSTQPGLNVQAPEFVPRYVVRPKTVPVNNFTSLGKVKTRAKAGKLPNDSKSNSEPSKENIPESVADKKDSKSAKGKKSNQPPTQVEQAERVTSRNSDEKPLHQNYQNSQKDQKDRKDQNGQKQQNRQKQQSGQKHQPQQSLSDELDGSSRDGDGYRKKKKSKASSDEIVVRTVPKPKSNRKKVPKYRANGIQQADVQERQPGELALLAAAAASVAKPGEVADSANSSGLESDSATDGNLVTTGASGGTSAELAELHSFKDKKPINVINKESHREALIDALRDSSYECPVCWNAIHPEATTWSCIKCYHICHLPCVKKWATTLFGEKRPADSRVWRCPMCQESYSYVPSIYKCFCGKARDPEWNRQDTPHSCGEICKKKRNKLCAHRCTDLCHPGPCPPCNAYVSKHCQCGRSYQKVRCVKSAEVKCKLVCDKDLNCGIHKCTEVCHSGKCKKCDEQVTLKCSCGAEGKTFKCGSAEAQQKFYSCGKVCSKPLSCGNHTCSLPCHQGDCPLCATSPEVVTHCACGKTELANLNEEAVKRGSCIDPVPTCGQTCNRVLSCYSTVNGLAVFHTCKLPCHTGDCLCELKRSITCRCKSNTVTMPCVEARQYTEDNPFLCKRKCAKKRSCGRHKCGEICCTKSAHNCTEICGRRLRCGRHHCEELCHTGNCPRCLEASFDELRCRCGAAVIYPPVDCGTRPPECDMICNRVHSCEHEVSHTCHSDPTCPPCVVLTQKLCMGGHEVRHSVPCHMTDISCGRPCGQPLQCGDHNCPQPCHKGDCNSTKCRQPCVKLRPCGHPCEQPCHVESDCPSLATNCTFPVELRCSCGERKTTILCYLMESKTRISAAVLSTAMKGYDSSVDISELMGLAEQKQLPCNERCAQIKRNKALASALEIVNPELLEKLSAANPFSDFLKKFARDHLKFISENETILQELVKSTQKAKQSSRSYVFPSMKRNHRKAVHELADYYLCESVSYDEEPNRNVVVTARKNKCAIPNVTLSDYIKYENHPRPPKPIPVDLQLSLGSRDKLSSSPSADEVKADVIDYFDMVS